LEKTKLYHGLTKIVESKRHAGHGSVEAGSFTEDKCKNISFSLEACVLDQIEKSAIMKMW
jgi:hypothetical protein